MWWECTGKNRDFHFTLMSVYAPPHKPMDQTFQAVQEVVSRSRSLHVIVAGDFNAKHRAWGPTDGDERGAHVMEYAVAASLVEMNAAVRTDLRGGVRHQLDRPYPGDAFRPDVRVCVDRTI